MDPQTTDQPPTEGALGGVSMFLVGLGIVSFVLFPLLLPGIAVLALFAAPFVPLLIPALLIWALLAVGAFVARLMRGRADRRAPRTPPDSPRRDQFIPQGSAGTPRR